MTSFLFACSMFQLVPCQFERKRQKNWRRRCLLFFLINKVYLKMDSSTEEIYFQKLQELVEDEDKIVRYLISTLQMGIFICLRSPFPV